MTPVRHANPRVMLPGIALFSLAAAAGPGFPVFAGPSGPPQPILSTTVEDFFQPGSQPDAAGTEYAPVFNAIDCSFCHGGYAVDIEPFRPWAASMMGQAARDPLFHAFLSIAGQDSPGSQEWCIRCHAPGAFLEARTDPFGTYDEDPSNDFDAVHFEGVNCNFCHRLVNPVFEPGVSPEEDESILDALETEGLLPPQGSNSRFVFDPVDARRGPFDDIPLNPHFGAEIIYSPFHRTSEFCWTCHDVSNPLMLKQPDGTFQLTAMDAAHPTADQEQMFPLHRTYSEWQNSYYDTLGGIQHNGRFGGNHVNNPDFIADGSAGIMHVCQDCHMPDQEGAGCGLGEPFAVRPDVPQHSFVGSNTWVLNAVRSLYPDAETGLTEETVAAMIDRNMEFLQAASDLEIAQVGGALRARIINFAGHKLPTGFPEGRRMWVNVKFFDVREQLILEHGTYDFETAALTTDDTTVYEIVMGIDAAQAAATGFPEGPTFHFVLANTIVKDNRIPPQGFSNVVAQQTQSAPVGATYANGQHWGDSFFDIPQGATNAVVTVYYQVTSKEFIEFLRDSNLSDDAGQVAYDQWVLHGMSPPVVIDMGEVEVAPGTVMPDLNGDGGVNAADLALLLGGWGLCPAEPPCPADLSGNGSVDAADLALLLGAWGPVA